MKLCDAITAGIRKLRADQQAKVAVVMQEWEQEFAQKALDAEYITQLDCTLKTTTHLMDFVDKVLPGLDEYYMCRVRGCAMVCLAVNWVNNHPVGGQYRCPACGEQYRPWLNKQGYYKANKVIFTYEQENKHQPLLVPGSSDGPVSKNVVNVFPVIWPDTATSMLRDRIKAISLDIDEKLLSLEPRDRMEFVLDTLKGTAPNKVFQHFKFKADIKKKIDELNAGQKSTKAKWQYAHVVEDGYWGLKLDDKHNLDEPMEQEDYIRMYGISMWYQDCVQKSIWPDVNNPSHPLFVVP
jgi:hypothetical protein